MNPAEPPKPAAAAGSGASASSSATATSTAQASTAAAGRVGVAANALHPPSQPPIPAQQPQPQPAPQQSEEEEHEAEEGDEEGEEGEEREEEQARFQQLFHTLMRGMVAQPRAPSTTWNGLVASLRQQEVIRTDAIERAFQVCPKNHFITKDLEDCVAVDSPLRVGTMGFNISAPHMYAMCLEALQLQPGMSFLDVGSGCGHLTALAAVLVGTAGRSHGIDVRKDIVEFAEENVKRLREKCGVELPQLRFFVRNCFAPDPEEMHYDRIHVGACCPTAKLEYLIGLLNPGGMLVTPYGDKLIKATKDLSGAHHIETVTPGVRYGDLCVPSEAEVEAAQRALESRRAEKVTVPPNTLLEDLAKLVNNKDLSDVCFVLEGQKVYAHRLVLQLRSSHFRAMLNGGMREASMSEIVIPQCPHSIFLLLLKTLYTGDVDFVNPSNCVEILEWANYFKVDRLKAQCEDVMRLGLDVDNAGSLLTVADRFDATQLRACIMEFMLRNFKAVSVTKAFKELDPELMMKITATAVSRLMGAQRGV